MYFGSITNKESGVTGSYTYMRRGTHIPLFPDLHMEDNFSDGYIPFETGKLFNKGTIGWKWPTILDIGVDIVVKLDKSCFIDQVIINQDCKSAVKSARVLCSDERGQFAYKGRVDAATDSMLEDHPLEVVMGVQTQDIIIRLDACFRDIIINEIQILGAILDSPRVYPVPVSIEIDRDTSIHISNLEHIIIANGASDDTIFAANLLKDKIYENHKLKLSMVCSDNVQSLSNGIIIGKCSENAVLDRNIKNKPSAEGYVIDALEDRIHIAGADRRGLIYGVETLLLLIQDEEIPSCTIVDHPFMEIRGAHFGLPPREEIPFLKRLIRYVLAPMGFNTIFLEFAGGMRFDRHPKISEAWMEGNKKAREGIWPPVPHGGMVAGGSLLEKHEVADLVDYARSYGFEVIPEVQSLGHVQYITMAYPEIAEIDDSADDDADIDLNKADRPPSEFYKGSYCPSNEKSYSIIFDIIDEIVEVVRPAGYVHMGHDEVYVIGTCSLCRDKEPAELLAYHINRMHAYLAQKGLKMMVWGDMLQNVTRYETPAAIDKIPKDIILLDFIWYFHLDKDIEDHLLNNGFEVIMGNMYSSHYPRFERRARKEGILGAEVSTWKRVDEYNLGFEGKIYDFIFSANMMWSSAYRSDLRLTYESMISKLMPGIRAQLHGQEYPSLSKTKKSHPIELPSTGKISPIPCELLATIPHSGEYVLKGIPFDFNSVQAVLSKRGNRSTYPETVAIPVEATYDSLIFLHAAGENVERILWMPPIQIGSYMVEYEDGTELEIPIEYGGNIGVWNRRQNKPIEHPYYRHQGYISTYFADAYIQSKTLEGRDVTIYGYEWINPYRDKIISSVTLAVKGDLDSPVMLFAITGINK